MIVTCSIGRPKMRNTRGIAWQNSPKLYQLVILGLNSYSHVTLKIYVQICFSGTSPSSTIGLL